MYRFSRAIYRDLQPYLLQNQLRPELGQRLLLSACERTIERLARDHRRFARPAASLFSGVSLPMILVLTGPEAGKVSMIVSA